MILFVVNSNSSFGTMEYKKLNNNKIVQTNNNIIITNK